MQNRYAGDVGDFGKLGMLRFIENSGLSIGVNWYLVEDESHNNDGKHIGYVKDKQFSGCDNELLVALGKMNEQSNRSVANIEKLHLLRTDKYFHEVLHGHNLNRGEWHQKGLEQLVDCNVVFLDPDNDLILKRYP